MKPLPPTRQGLTRREIICGNKVFITVNFFENGEPCEVFATVAKIGSTLQGFVNVVCILVSALLRNGVPWSEVREKLRLHHFVPSDDKDSSIVHGIARVVDELIGEWKNFLADRKKEEYNKNGNEEHNAQ